MTACPTGKACWLEKFAWLHLARLWLISLYFLKNYNWNYVVEENSILHTLEFISVEYIERNESIFEY